MLAIVGLEVCFLVASRTASILAFALGLVNHRGRNNTCRNSDDGVTKNHDDAGQKASNNSDRGDVTITDGSEGNNRPIDAGADVGELRTWLCSFYNEHERANDGDEDEDKGKIDEYLAETQTDALHQEVAFVDEGEELEHTEDTDESEHTQNEEIACRREARDEGEVERQGRQKVNDAKETEGVAFGMWRTVKSENVFDGKEEGKNILHHSEHVLETSHHGRFGLDECHYQTENNRHHHRDVECLARLRVGIEHDIVEAWLIFEQCYKLFHGAKVGKS